MFKISTDKPLTIKARYLNNGPAVICDLRGDVLYKRSFSSPRYFELNLPYSGNFIARGFDVISKKELVKDTIKTDLPEPDRNYEKKFPVLYDEKLTGTPARNYYEKGIIVVGPKFKKLTYPVRLFILLHENAHFLYSDEKNADLWAFKQFIEKYGQNYSQAIQALKDVLNLKNEYNKQRVINIYKHCKLIK